MSLAKSCQGDNNDIPQLIPSTKTSMLRTTVIAF